MLTALFHLNLGNNFRNFVPPKKQSIMANRNIILLHIFETDEYEFYGSPASLYDRHDATELLISQNSLNNHFSKQQLAGNPLIYKNTYCEIRKGCIYVKTTTRGRKKEA